MRALSRELAIAGHDYFEVVFYYRAADPANNVIARTSWELYRDARITGVQGKGAGETAVDYGALSASGLTAGSGAAILFVGRKTDKTLLAVGRLARVNDVPATTEISPTTRTVTFDVVALDCGVKRDGASLAQSSFLTAFGGTSEPSSISAANTIASNRGFKEDFDLGGTDVGFPLFKLREDNQITYAKYEFFTATGTSLNTQGIIQAGEGVYELKQPRYPTADGRFQYFSVILDKNTRITAVNNQYAGVDKPFENPVLVTFDPTGTEKGSLASFVFQIPVYPIAGPIAGKPDPGTWYIRPSFDSYFLDLDDGGTAGSTLNGAGGAVLIGYGDVGEIDGFRIRVVAFPDKYLYGTSPNSPPADNVNGGNRRFNIEGLVVEFQNMKGDRLRYVDNKDLEFEIGGISINPWTDPTTTPPTIPTSISNSLWGIQYVEVIYVFNGVIHKDFFVILVEKTSGAGAGKYANILQQNIVVIDDWVQDSQVGGYIDSSIGNVNDGTRPSHTFVIVADRDFNLGTAILNEEPYVIIVVAGSNGDLPNGTKNSALTDPTGLNNRVIGRAGADGSYGNAPQTGGAFTCWGPSSNAFYFGPWPFKTPLNAYRGDGSGPSTTITRTYSYLEQVVIAPNQVPQSGSPAAGSYDVHKTYPFIINAAGPYTDVTGRRRTVMGGAVLADIPNPAPQYNLNPLYTGTVGAGTPAQYMRDSTPAQNGSSSGGGTNPTHVHFIYDGHGGTIWNVRVGNDVHIKYKAWFQ
jgi:hypothetical protein